MPTTDIEEELGERMWRGGKGRGKGVIEKEAFRMVRWSSERRDWIGMERRRRGRGMGMGL